MASIASPLSFEQVAERLIADGLQANKTALVRRLQAMGEFKFTSYAEFFLSGSNYLPGTTLEAVLRLWEFDKRLRYLCFEAIENIEVQVRTQLSYRFANKHGHSNYLDQANFPNFSSNGTGFTWWKDKVNEAADRVGKDIANAVPVSAAGLPNAQPAFSIFEIAEYMDFGTALSFFQGVGSDIQKATANTVGQPDKVVESWLIGLRDVRNKCAHNQRIWNRQFSSRVKMPQRRKFPEWHSPKLPNNRMGIFLTICRYWLNRIHPGNDWTQRVLALFDAYPEIPSTAMGFPGNWRKHPLWCV